MLEDLLHGWASGLSEDEKDTLNWLAGLGTPRADKVSDQLRKKSVCYWSELVYRLENQIKESRDV